MNKHLILTSSILLGSFTGPALADSGDGFGHAMWGGGYGIFGGIMMLAFWGLIIGLIVLAVRGFPGRSDNTTEMDALNILRERFARGEIDEAEYDRRKAKLEN